MIYFIRQGDAGPIKIGYSRRLKARIKTLQTSAAEPIQILAVMPGTPRDEARLHRQFAHLRMNGEWFEPAAYLTSFVAQVFASHGAEVPDDQVRHAARPAVKKVEDEDDSRHPDIPAAIGTKDLAASAIQQLIREVWGTDREAAKQIAVDTGCAVNSAQQWIDGEGSPNGFSFIALIRGSDEFYRGVLKLIGRKDKLRRRQASLAAALLSTSEELESLPE